MTNTKILKEKINDSGYKLVFLAKKLGITSYTFMKKIKNKTEFKATEIKTLSKMLKINQKETVEIFFGTDIDFKSTKTSKLKCDFRHHSQLNNTNTVRKRRK